MEGEYITGKAVFLTDRQLHEVFRGNLFPKPWFWK